MSPPHPLISPLLLHDLIQDLNPLTLPNPSLPGEPDIS